MANLHNKVAIVTGAGRGIGRAIAVELARAGARVALAARSQPQLDETVALIGGAAQAFPTDVRKWEQVRALFGRTVSELGPVDILVNCAGLGIYAPVIDFSEEDFTTTIDTNLRGTFLTCREVLPSMIERQTGHIVNVASIAGKVGSANRAVYCASKFGVVGFTESLAEEVRQHGIRAAVICPGSTDTGFGTSTAKAREKMLKPEDVAYAVGMLVMQEANSFISEIVMRPTRKP
jgi:NAD(P)-dependent dehydrogenase (short-subunit alcohol dehydrogenase family)